MTPYFNEPDEFAAAPLASGEPIVREPELCTGGLQDGNARGGPCWRLGDPHALYAGTSDARMASRPGPRVEVTPVGHGRAGLVPADRVHAVARDVEDVGGQLRVVVGEQVSWPSSLTIDAQ